MQCRSANDAAAVFISKHANSSKIDVASEFLSFESSQLWGKESAPVNLYHTSFQDIAHLKQSVSGWVPVSLHS